MKRGFTLIELLVVVAIIGMLSSVVLSSLNTARGNARDARRLQDLRQLQTAFELYYSANGGYPTEASGANGIIEPGGNLEAALVPNYIPSLPADPQNSDPYVYYYDGRHNCANSPDHPVAIIFAREMESSNNSNYAQTLASCGSIGGEGRSSGTNSYNIIIGPSSG